MPIDPAFALIHSPLVGPVTWEPVAQRLAGSGRSVIVPSLSDSPDAELPFWRQHAFSASAALSRIPAHQPIIYVAHSGAGALLPSIRTAASNPVAGYIFVDAGLPEAHASRLDMMRREDSQWAASFHQTLLDGAAFPSWNTDELRGLIPDDHLRLALVSSIQPRKLDFFTEPIDVFEGWPDAQCGYIRFSASYNKPAEEARSRGWPVIDLPSGHFHMLVDPQVVTGAILKIVDSWSPLTNQ